jgi:type IV pilus assembly protein PilV
MLTGRSLPGEHQQGTSLLEVLVSIVILAIGLLGLLGLHGKIQVGEHESYQRAQAILLLSDMAERISANRSQAASYVSNATFGAGDNQPTSCLGLPIGPSRDLCDWSNALKGASEQKSAANLGAMIGARGCITQLQAANSASGVCTPAIYQVAIAWQGLHQTIAPNLNCGSGLYGSDETLRRVISGQITTGLTACQ